MKLESIVLAAALLLPQVLYAEDAGSMLKAENLREKPFLDAKIQAALAAGEKVSIKRREGGWLLIDSPGGRGWVRMLSVKKGSKAEASSSGILQLASGRAGTGRVVATTGIRGLSEEDLKSAQFSPQELAKAESYAAGSSDARKFAAAGGLAAQHVGYLQGAK